MEIFHNPEPIEVDRKTWKGLDIIVQKEIIRKAQFKLDQTRTSHSEFFKSYQYPVYMGKARIDLENEIKRAKTKLILLGVNPNEESKG